MTTAHALPFLDGDRIRGAVPMTELLDAVEAAYRDVAAGRDRSPLRSHVELSDGALLLMPGVLNHVPLAAQPLAQVHVRRPVSPQGGPGHRCLECSAATGIAS